MKKQTKLKYKFMKVKWPWVNRQHKDTVFRLLFNGDKKALLELYNAINHSNYDDPEKLIINTLDNAIFMGMHNDVSFILDTHLTLFEHQSTKCPNIPLRCLFYVSKLYAQIVDEKNIFSSSIKHIPEPHFVVFYNGIEDLPEEMTYRLTDMYENPSNDPALELKVKVFNINYGKNESLMRSCQTLNGYSIYVAKIREYSKRLSKKAAVEHAIDYCIENDILKDFFLKERRAITMFSLYEYDYEGHMNLIREEGREKGHEEIINNMLKKNYSLTEIADITGCSLDEIKQIQAKNLAQSTQQL